LPQLGASRRSQRARKPVRNYQRFPFAGPYRWWEMPDEKALSDEIKRQLGHEIPLGKRSQWRAFLADQQAEHQRLTDAIIALETRLNEIVYDAFDLTPEERDLIESTTKYPYGEV
jgi:hypothetical protein